LGLEGRGLLSSGGVTLLATGFLGSFSTLSTFLAEVQGVLGKGEWAQALGLATTAVLGGLLALLMGLALVSVR
jgi:CrcB protein